MKDIEVKIPPVGESITEVVIAQWLKKDGDSVREDETLCEIESDKATVELPSPSKGILKILINAGESVKVGTVVATISANSADVVIEKQNHLEVLKAEVHEIKPQTQPPVMSPSAEKIIRENNIVPESIQGTGKDGRIIKEDVLIHVEKADNDVEIIQLDTSKSLVVMTGAREIKREKMSTLRKTIAKRLLHAKNQTAMLTTFNEINMFELINLRKKYKDAFKEKYEINLGYMSFFTKAVCLALEKFPIVNAQIDGEEVLYHHYADIGVAVSTPKGLVVPVVRNAEILSLAQIEKNIGNLANKARDGKLTMDEMSGGTFTITNGGVFGSMLSTPILNSPQSAILGMHNIVDRPWVVGEDIKIRPIMYVALSYDHRLIDGKDSVSFLKTVKELIEDPSRLLLDI